MTRRLLAGSSISLITAFVTGQTRILANGSNYNVIRDQRVAFCPIQNLVISSSDLPFVSGISHPTSTIVSKAPPLNTQNVPSDPHSFCITGNIWFPRYPPSHRAVVAIDMPRPLTFVG